MLPICVMVYVLWRFDRKDRSSNDEDVWGRRREFHGIQKLSFLSFNAFKLAFIISVKSRSNHFFNKSRQFSISWILPANLVTSLFDGFCYFSVFIFYHSFRTYLFESKSRWETPNSSYQHWFRFEAFSSCAVQENFHYLASLIFSFFYQIIWNRRFGLLRFRERILVLFNRYLPSVVRLQNLKKKFELKCCFHFFTYFWCLWP